MSETQIRVITLQKRYGPIEALRGVSFAVKRGSVTAFLGENGAGKTTTIKIILGFLRSDSGLVEMNCGRLGFVPDRPVFLSWLTGKEILEATARLYQIDRLKLDNLIEEFSTRICFDLALLKRKPHTYSLGNQKKISYLQNLIIEPELLIVDEPFAGLDPVSIKQTRDLFLELKRRRKTVFLSSHLISELEKICDEVVIIRRGKILLEGPLQELCPAGEGNLEALFLSLHPQAEID